MKMQTTSAVAPATATTSTLNRVTRLVSLLLLSSLTVKSFSTRWQTLRVKLSNLHSSLKSISSSPHFSENQLLQTLLPTLYSTLQQLKTLADQCLDPGFKGGKLLMQSDLDRCSNSLSNLLHHFDLLINSGALHHSNALVLSHPGPDSEAQDLIFFIRDLFARLEIGGPDFKTESLNSLINILEQNSKSAAVIPTEANLSYLIQLLEFNHQDNQSDNQVRELAALALSMLCAAEDSVRKAVFEEGGLGPLLRLIETASVTLRERAAAAVESITSDPDNAWAISAYGGVSILLNACKSGHQSIQNPAVGAIRNISNIPDIRTTLVEEGGITVLVNLIISSSNQQIVYRAVNSISVLASSDRHVRDLIIRENCLQRLIKIVLDSFSSTPIALLEHSLRAILALSSNDPVARTVSLSTHFVMKISELIKYCNNVTIQHISASLISKLTLTEVMKRSIGTCSASLLKLMELPKPVGLQESATKALLSILSVKSNCRDLIGDEKSVTRLVKLLDPRNATVTKEFPVMVAYAVVVGGGHGCKKRLLEAGAYGHLQVLAGMDVAGAKKAVQRFVGAGSWLMSMLFWRG